MSTKICSKCKEEKSLTSFYYESTKKLYRSECKVCNQLFKYNQRKNNPELIKIWRQNNYKNNRNTIIKNQLEYEKRKYKEDPIFKLKYTLRRRFKMALKNNAKTGSAVKDLGCSIEEFKKYLETKFISGMSWENYGEWHIDHIRPLSSFNLENREELLQACHYSNLQPLWAEDNLKKGSKYVKK